MSINGACNRARPPHTIHCMNEQTTTENAELTAKIARLVEERGWNQQDFARIASLNLQTVRQILHPTGTRKLRNATIGNIARALGLTVHELRGWPLERLLPRMTQPRPPLPADAEEAARHRLYEEATQPELRAWLDRHPDRGRELTEGELEELLSLQGTGGPLTSLGVEHYVKQIERKRRLFAQIHVIAGTEYIDVLEKLVELMYHKVQPYRDRL